MTLPSYLRVIQLASLFDIGYTNIRYAVTRGLLPFQKRSEIDSDQRPTVA